MATEGTKSLERDLIEGFRELSPKEQKDFMVYAQGHFDTRRRHRAYVEAGMDNETAAQKVVAELKEEIMRLAVAQEGVPVLGQA